MMKFLIFLIAIIFQICVNAQVQSRTFGTQFYKLDPQGTFLTYPQFGTTNPATRINLSDVHPSIANGALIGIKSVGGWSYTFGVPDDSASGALAVFVDINNNPVQAGPKTNASNSGPFYFCGLNGSVDYPFDLIIGEFSTQGTDIEIEVPEGAVALLFAPPDCPLYDNGDADGNYGVQITYPVVRTINADIYQVVKNPRLSSVSTAIDLVAGKNADVVVTIDGTIGKNLDVSGSEIVWQSASADLSKKTTYAIPAGTKTNDKGEVTFQIDPVPKGAEYLSGPTKMKITIRRPGGAGYEDFGVKEIDVRARKTKPIKLGFVPISGCGGVVNDCFTGATNSDSIDMEKNGSSIMRVMYPVADDDFSVLNLAPQALAINLPFDIPLVDFGSIFDFYALNKLKDEVHSDKELTHIVGISTEKYFEYVGLDIWGYAPSSVSYKLLGINNTVIVTAGAYTTLAHEIGHTFGLNHRCPGIPFLEPCATEETTTDGYSNYELPNTVWAKLSAVDGNWLKRDLIEKSGYNGRPTSTPIYSLMREDVGVTIRADYLQWTSRQEYLELFKANLQQASLQDKSIKNVLRINGVVDSEFKLVSAYFFKKDFSGLSTTGSYIAEVKDVDGNLLATYLTNSYSITAKPNQKLLEFVVDVTSKTELVDIFKIEGDQKFQIGRVVITADTLSEEIKYVTKDLVLTNLKTFQNTIKEYIKEYRELILNKNTNDALSVLIQKLSPYIEKNMLNKVSNFSDLSADKALMQNRLTTSILRLVNLTDSLDLPVNPFIEVFMNNFSVQMKSTIEIKPIKNPENKNYEFVYKARIDGILNSIKVTNNKILSESPKLVLGNHVWTVQTYIVDKKLHNSIEIGISKYRFRKFQLEITLEEETDLEKRDAIQVEINKITSLINKLNSELEELLHEVGTPATLRFML